METTKEITFLNITADTKTIVIIDNKNVRVAVPTIDVSAVPTPKGKIKLTTLYGTTESKTDFTYNSNVPNQSSAAPITQSQTTSTTGTTSGTTTTQAASIPPKPNSQPQQTGPLVLLDDSVTNLIGSVSLEKIIVNPDAGPWKIVPQFTDWSYQAVHRKAGPNNTVVEEVIDKLTNSRDLEVYVASNGKSFSVTDLSIVKLVEDNIDDPAEMKKVDRIYNQVTLSCVHEDKYVKFKQTNNPNDVINDVFQTFRFTIFFK